MRCSIINTAKLQGSIAGLSLQRRHIKAIFIIFTGLSQYKKWRLYEAYIYRRRS